MQEAKMVAYIRVHKANVGIVGCDEHVNHVFEALRNAPPYDPATAEGQPRREIVRLKEEEIL